MKPHLKDVLQKLRLGWVSTIPITRTTEWLCNPWKVDYNLDVPSHGPASGLLVFDNADDPDEFRP